MRTNWMKVVNNQIIVRSGVRLQAQIVELRFPFIHGSFTWNRPVAVIVTNSGQTDQMIPVQDVTRMTQIGLGFVILAITWLYIFLRK
jgi:hypothetical protein